MTNRGWSVWVSATVPAAGGSPAGFTARCQDTLCTRPSAAVAATGTAPVNTWSPSVASVSARHAAALTWLSHTGSSRALRTGSGSGRSA